MVFKVEVSFLQALPPVALERLPGNPCFSPGWGSSRMLLGGFKVDFESVWVGSELICARCAARFLH